MTPMEAQAQYVIDSVCAQLTPIWLGGRQRAVLTAAISAALTDAYAQGRRAGLEEAATGIEDGADALYESSHGNWITFNPSDPKSVAAWCRAQAAKAEVE